MVSVDVKHHVHLQALVYDIHPLWTKVQESDARSVNLRIATLSSLQFLFMQMGSNTSTHHHHHHHYHTPPPRPHLLYF